MLAGEPVRLASNSRVPIDGGGEDETDDFWPWTQQSDQGEGEPRRDSDGARPGFSREETATDGFVPAISLFSLSSTEASPAPAGARASDLVAAPPAHPALGTPAFGHAVEEFFAGMPEQGVHSLAEASSYPAGSDHDLDAGWATAGLLAVSNGLARHSRADEKRRSAAWNAHAALFGKWIGRPDADR
jgi:hypothetical protein